ncbi:hypothetical protein BG015_009779 [Linnemannia schmuckeri]|uniref:F-box domain-containing protein n=1 Tax=Linnemannia schmuckeri TaxID=64567 RepID=A0A9P5V9J6_9FUNG|nr:hypothetical protein BG015_009779 [Linnemannia schmuckeri]
MYLIGGQTHPLDLPEIRTRIAMFLDITDCISCMQVNKTWHRDFAGSVWHTVDFEDNETFAEISPTTVTKYGHLIRRAINIVKEDHISALLNPAIKSLLVVKFNITNNPVSRAFFFDVFHQNKASITTLELSASLLDPETDEDQRTNAIYFMTLDMPVSGSKLTHLYLCSLNFTRHNFSDILHYSPKLHYVHMFGVMLLANKPHFELVHHYGVKMLVAPMVQMCDLRAEFLHYCPHLVNTDFENEESEPDDVADLLVEAFNRLQSCRIYYSLLNKTTVVGILQHQDTLTHLELALTEDLTDPSLSDPNPYAKNLVLLILRSCRNLRIFRAEGHQMDIDLAEDYGWSCIDLIEMRFRFQGLDTFVAIDDCLEQLSAMKSQGLDGTETSERSLSLRICQKLLPLKKLQTVWLDSKDYSLATH